MERKAVEAVKNVLNLEYLKDYQIESLSSLLRGKDCFISQPTGSGKSAVYQLFPFAYEALELLNDKDFDSKAHDSKTTICKILVIQPLISLMSDQTKKLENLGIKVCRLAR
jgi:superfamily II DNA helicase RecQ